MSRTINKTTTTSTGTVIPQSVTYSDITVDKVEVGMYQKDGTLTAQIRQTVTTISNYPSKQVDSDKQGGLFATEDFGFTSQPFTNTENRVAWIPVPVGTTLEQVQAKVTAANLQGATIYRVMSNQPILDKNQKNAVAIGLGDVTLDTFANRQIVRYPAGTEQEGQICLDANNKVQYRRTFFWNTPLEDQDLRSADPADVYMSPEITLELSANTPASVGQHNVMEGQAL
jgi:hypothetical protein